MKTFVLIAGIWFNVDNIAALEDGYRESGPFNEAYSYCRIVTTRHGGSFTIKDESCADIVRDVTTQMEDPN